MVGYRVLSILQFVFIFITSLSILDLGVPFGMNDAFFGEGATGWWSVFPFWAYMFALVAICQLVKAIIVTEAKK